MSMDTLLRTHEYQSIVPPNLFSITSYYRKATQNYSNILPQIDWNGCVENGRHHADQHKEELELSSKS